MGMSSKKNGDAGEILVASEIFRKHRYWAHIIQRNRNGQQPFDIVAAKGNKVWLIDAKYVAKGHRFTFSDVQPDQEESMRYATDFADLQNVGFAIVFAEHGKVSFLSYTEYFDRKTSGDKSVALDELGEFDPDGGGK